MSDINDRIALAKGWKRMDVPTSFSLSPTRHTIQKWRAPNPDYPLLDQPPDFTGTLDGVAGMMREMLDSTSDVYLWAPQMTGWMCVNSDWSQCWFSDLEHPGDCVGEAWLSVFGKENNK